MKVKFLDELEVILERFQIAKDEICIIGSSVLAFADIRENHDLDFALYPEARDRVLKLYSEQVEVLPSGTINFSSNIQSLQNRYAKIGLLDEEIFNDSYTMRMNGLRVARIEMEFAQKVARNYDKDRKDMEKIGDVYLKFPEFDIELYESLKRKKKGIIFGAGRNANIAYNCYATRFELVCYVDNNENLWGSKINGLEVCSPDILKNTKEAFIIISSINNAESIKNNIYEKYGKHKVITFCMKEEISIL